MREQSTNVWMPEAGVPNGGGTLIFKDGTNWDIIHNLATLDIEKKAILTSMEVEIVSGKVANFMLLADGVVCDERAFTTIMPVIRDEVAVIPLLAPSQRFFYLHAKNFIDCLDVENSIFILSPTAGSIVDIEKYRFFTDQVIATYLFRIPNLPTRVFCTDSFKSLVEAHNLSGLAFKVPFSPLRALSHVF